MLLGGEVGPRDTSHAILSSILMIVGALITAVLFGEMAVLMSNLNRKSTRFQEIQDTVNTAMKNMKLPEDIQIKITEYLIYTQSLLDSQQEYDKFEQMISPSLKEAVDKVIYNRIIEQNEIFKGNEEITQFISKKLSNIFAQPEKTIITQGEVGKNMYFLAKGDCEVFVFDELKIQQYVNILRPGSHFGEVALIYNQIRSATVKAKNYSTVAELSAEHFNELRINFPECITKFKSLMINYQDRWKVFLKKMFLRILYLATSTNLHEELVYAFVIKSYEPGNYIFKPGDVIDSILFITDGEAEVSFTINDKNINKHKLIAAGKEGEEIDKKYEIDIRLFTKKLRNLKQQTQMMPLLSMGKIVDSAQVDHITQEQLPMQLGQFTQEIIIDKVWQGSVLFQFNALLSDTAPQRQALQCKSHKQTTIYSLPASKFHQLSNSSEGIQLKQQMGEISSQMLKYDSQRQE